MIAFLAAFSYECFAARDHATLGAAGAAWTIIGLLILWFLYVSWTRGGYEDAWYKKAVAAFKEKVAHYVRIRGSNVQV